MCYLKIHRAYENAGKFTLKENISSQLMHAESKEAR